MTKIKFFALVIVIMFLPVFSQESPGESGLDCVEEQADSSSMNWTNKVLRKDWSETVPS